MADTSGVYTLGQITRRVLRQLRSPKSEYKHYLNLIVDGYIDLRLYHVSKGERTVKATIDTDLDIIDLDNHPDFLELISLNIPVNGELWPLTKRPKMVNTITGTSPETRDTDNGEGSNIYLQTSNSYSTRGGVNYAGYYDIDYEKNRILLTNLISGTEELVMQYKTSGVSATETTYIPVHYYPALEAYVRWKESIDLKPNLMREYERQYNIEFKKLKYLTMPSGREFLDILRSNYTQLPNRT